MSKEHISWNHSGHKSEFHLKSLSTVKFEMSHIRRSRLQPTPANGV